MKIRAIGLGLMLAAAAAAGAEAFSVLLTNPEEAVFHFVLDPPELASFDPGSSVFANVVYDYFFEKPQAGPASFRSLAAGATVRLKDLAEGNHLLVGFFALAKRREYPVRVLQLKAGGGLAERVYSVYAEPAQFKARAGRGRLAAFPPVEAASAAPAEAATPAAAPVPQGAEAAPSGAQPPQAATAAGAQAPPAAPAAPGELAIRIDNDYADWEAIPVLRSFADYRPRTFTRERIGGKRAELPLEQARFWQKGGTGLAELKLVDNGPSLYLFLSTRSAMAEGLSLYLYFRDPLDPEGRNRVTVELVPATGNKAGLVALWVKDREPEAAGTLASGAFFLEAALDKRLIFSALSSGRQAGWLVLTAGYHDRNSLTYEEFYYLQLPLGELPTPDTLYDP
jgi:hypothetical protein